jgi:hypothetical protein
MLTYIGKGYSKAFIENFSMLTETINQNKITALVVEGPDDICAPRLCDPCDTSCHCLDDRHETIDLLALADLRKIETLEKIEFDQEVDLSTKLISTLRHHFKEGKIRSACTQCEWVDLCSEIAKNNFEDTKLK